MPLPKVYLNFTTSLASSITDVATALTLTTSVDDDGTTLSGSYLLTLSEGTSSEEHMLVTLAGAAGTIVTRGLSRVDATTNVSGNQFDHGRGATVKITNAPLVKIVNQLNGDEDFDSPDWTGVNSISDIATPTSGELTKAANIEYVNDIAISGSPDATTSVKGISKMSVAPVSATDPIAVGDNDNRVSPVSLATVDAGIVDALQGTSGTPSSSNEYVTDGDTDNAATANKVARYDANGDMIVPTTPTDGDAAASKSYVDAQDLGGTNILTRLSSDVTVSSSSSEETLLSATVTGGDLSSTGIITGKLFINLFDLDNGDNAIIRLKYGSTTVCTKTITGTAGIGNKTGAIDFSLTNTGSTSAQSGIFNFMIVSDTSSTGSLQSVMQTYDTGTATEDSTTNLTLSITIQYSSTDADNVTTIAAGSYAYITQ